MQQNQQTFHNLLASECHAVSAPLLVQLVQLHKVLTASTELHIGYVSRLYDPSSRDNRIASGCLRIWTATHAWRQQSQTLPWKAADSDGRTLMTGNRANRANMHHLPRKEACDNFRRSCWVRTLAACWCAEMNEGEAYRKVSGKHCLSSGPRRILYWQCVSAEKMEKAEETCMYIYVYTFIDIIYIYIFIYSFIHLSICLFIYLFISLTICRFIHLHIHITYVCRFACVCACVSVGCCMQRRVVI